MMCTYNHFHFTEEETKIQRDLTLSYTYFYVSWCVFNCHLFLASVPLPKSTGKDPRIQIQTSEPTSKVVAGNQAVNIMGIHTHLRFFPSLVYVTVTIITTELFLAHHKACQILRYHPCGNAVKGGGGDSYSASWDKGSWVCWGYRDCQRSSILYEAEMRLVTQTFPLQIPGSFWGTTLFHLTSLSLIKCMTQRSLLMVLIYLPHSDTTLLSLCWENPSECPNWRSYPLVFFTVSTTVSCME